jgi:hypothetical protein
MRKQQFISISLFITYAIIIAFTDFSLTGFWTDMIFLIVIWGYILSEFFKKNWLIYTFTLIIGTFLGILLINPFILDTLKMRSFLYQQVNNRLFNAYFKPVGAYSGGYGNFWITESPKYFPFIEKRVYYDRTVHHDFNDDTSEGQPIDNYEVVREYIKKEIIEK